MENTQPLDAGLRTELGKGPNRRLRASGMIPAVVYGRGQETIHLKVDPTTLGERLGGEYGKNAVFKLNIEGSDASPVVRVLEIQRDPVKRFLKHVDFQSLRPDQQIIAQIPLELTGIAKGIKAGGHLRQIRWTVKGTVVASNMPRALTMDISDLGVGDMARVADIDLPEGLELLYSDNYAVASVRVARGLVVVEDEEGEEGEEGEEEAEA
jgi:large subunit ribosomal protein L25